MTWILEQAVDASFCELTLPNHWQLSDFGCRALGIVLRCTRAYSAEPAHTCEVCIVK